MTTLRFFLLIMAMGAVAIGLSIWASQSKLSECESKNGLLVKTMQGWTCIDAKIVK